MPAESKRRKLDGAWQTSQSQIAASLNSTSRASASIALPSQPLQLQNAPVQSLPPPMVSNNPFRDRRQMMLDALVGLSPDDRRLVEEQLQPDGDYERDAAEVLALRSQNQTRKPNQWIASMRKIACQILQFAPVADVAINVKPEVLSLPWAGIRFLLMTAQKVHHQEESILKGIEIALDTTYLLNVYFDIYGRLDGTPTIGNLYHNMVKLYALILKFVAHARNTCEMNRWERIVHSLTGVVIPNFEIDHNGVLKTAEHHARAVDREVSEEQRAWVNEQLKALRKAQEEVSERIKGVQQLLDLNALQAAAGAAYDSMDYRNADDIGELHLCLAGTRVDIKRKILDWAITANDQRVFWLCGKAGTGKSTIARTVADELAKQGYLVGSFFFKRGRGELCRARSLFPTIARQMADFVPSISHEIAAASKGSPPVNERPLTTQFDTLIKGPLSGYGTGSATDIRVIVIDALDECEDWGAIGHAMTLWPSLRAQSSMNLRVFVTSRSDNKIGDKLSEMGHKDLQHERLEHWQSSTIEGDLRLFCHDELRRLREQSRKESSYDELEDDWPGESVVDKLVEISKPLFIAASTIFREASNDPRRQLREWVDRLNFTGSERLNCIYSGILEQASKVDPRWLGHLKRAIEPIVVLRAPLSIPALTDLLGDGDNMVVPNALKPLSSVIDFPSGKEVKSGSRATVRIYHESFRDFLVDPNLKDKSQFSIDKGKTHGILLTRCLDLLTNKLGRDVCKQKDPATERKDVSAEHVEKHLSESVQYACRYWVSHAVKSNETLEDGGKVDCSLRACFLHWTEAMAWLDKLGELIICLKKLQEAIDSQSSPKLHAFVADALRWVPASQNMISDAPLQTYLSAVASAPSNSVVRNSFRSEEEEFLQVWQPVATDWGFELQTLRGHSDYILSITPSIDGRRLVTIASDNTARLWDVESGTEEKSTEINSSGGSIPIFASAFPEEDIVVIAGSSGDYWRWNLEDDARPINIKLPGVAASVSVSPNGQYAAWGLDTGEIYIWDADNNSEEGAGQVLKGHNSPVWCLHFSSDSETLVSGSTDIWKWSPQAGHKMVYQVGADIERITISPNGKFVVFLSGTISVFHCTTHQVDQIKRNSRVYSLMVTPDSQKVLFGDWFGLYLYDFQTQQGPMKLGLGSRVTATTSSRDGKTIWAGYHNGRIIQLDLDLALKTPHHRTGPATLALSTDGRSLASWSYGNHLSVWNIETRICERRLTDHRLINHYMYYPRQILISSDSRFVVVACIYQPLFRNDSAVLIWDMDADELRELKDRPRYVTALALSPDNKTLLCGLRDGQIWAIDLERGLLREKFTGHTEIIYNIAISPDGQNFASASYDKTVRIWGPKSQTPLVLSSEETMYEACFSADGRMLYTWHSYKLYEWDIEKACIVRTLAEGPEYGSIPIDGHFVSSAFLPVVDRLAANEDNQPQTQADSSASTSSTSMFQDRQIWALDPTYQWITVNGRKMFKRPDLLRWYDWFSCGRTMTFPNEETGFTVLYFTGKDSF
ncbi:tricorn protease domain 2-containing protein [Piedraia hortae CBS 480.64]|uniref:Tricorn protease domain 2-containing protein n=1 Tax=Piedraia hortae CBS 480.64 TaxID=1314780 RepID=A0A6A7BQT0_9PEZI|nr:tricorn protease domain 2-containing protein [Piedraia hortae CBS 480.64]